MQWSFLVRKLAKWLLDNMEMILTDIVHSNTYGGNLWLMQLNYEYCQGYMYKVVAGAGLQYSVR